MDACELISLASDDIFLIIGNNSDLAVRLLRVDGTGAVLQVFTFSTPVPSLGQCIVWPYYMDNILSELQAMHELAPRLMAAHFPASKLNQIMCLEAHESSFTRKNSLEQEKSMRCVGNFQGTMPFSTRSYGLPVDAFILRENG